MPQNDDRPGKRDGDRDSGSPLFSEYADSDDMLEIIEMFVDEMPSRVDELEGSMEAGDMDRLAVLLHQIKGSAAGYGFRPISNAALEAEQTLNGDDRDVEALNASVRSLCAMCLRASSSRRQDPSEE